ncbi:hypothetical protein [Limimaricola sp.]|uniref:hypothetical protein n=1 Tax=Limimaricola sp. TaxID=2211665 RepID=UPI004058E102
MKILILPDPDAAAARVVAFLVETLAARPEAVLGWPRAARWSRSMPGSSRRCGQGRCGWTG